MYSLEVVSQNISQRMMLTKRRSMIARVIKLWWKVDLLSFLQIITIAATLPAIPPSPTMGRVTLSMQRVVMSSTEEDKQEQFGEGRSSDIALA